MTVGREMNFAIVRNYSQNRCRAIDFFSTRSLDVPDNKYPDSWARRLFHGPKPIIDALMSEAEKVIKARDSAPESKTHGVVQYVSPAEPRSMIERDKNTAAALEMAKKEGLQ